MEIFRIIIAPPPNPAPRHLLFLIKNPMSSLFDEIIFFIISWDNKTKYVRNDFQ